MKTQATPVLNLNELPWPADQPEHFIFDVDGTLTDEHSVTHQPTIDALKAVHNAGYPITLATGRVLHAGISLLDRAGIDGWVIANCGSVVWDGTEVVHEYPMPTDQLKAFIELGRSIGVVPAVYFTDSIVMDAADFNIDNGQHNLLKVATNANEGQPIEQADLFSIDLSHATKVQFGGDATILDKFQDRVLTQFPEAVRGHPYALEITPDGIDKWTGISAALQDRGLSAEGALGVGDSGNDVPWLPKVGISIAAPQSTPDVIAVSDFVLPDIDFPVAELMQSIVRRTR
ncbi:HAD-IIB family hydrolase [Flaviflexus massiliensis]|uniref:HAD-IIB family hydrolase n=1 Tax=Flaviflexus massiliensis TaxID=1522309 RepID=UPI0006D53793|nr:HAD family hydrolase [Flaviflexus massiliensis]